MTERWLSLLAVVGAGCGQPDALPPRGQVLLFADTDAVVPDGALLEDPSAPASLFDRLSIEVLPPDGDPPCPTCLREFVVDRGLFERAEASMGIVPRTGESGYRARLRLFRASTVLDEGEPPRSTTLEMTIALPAVREEGVVEVTATLMTDSVGVPMGDATAPLEPTPGRPSGTRVGTWAPAQRVPCASAPGPGEVCVPGGAYWMGETNLIAPDIEGAAERLVVISPFFMDAAEVDVASFRGSSLAVVPWSGTLDGLDENAGDQDWCTFTVEPSDRDPLPVNCMPWSAARELCLAQGKDLPSEAQWEYAARALSGRRFVWGSEPPDCDDAVWGHGFASTIAPACPPPNVIGGPQQPGRGQRDRLELEGGTLVDVAGNVREWMRDVWNREDEPCWLAPLLFDPVCSTAGALGPHTYATRGDSWGSPLVYSAAARSLSSGNAAASLLGFRCARPAR